MIDVQNLSFGYGGEALLSGVSCCLEDRCITAVIGPNGAGKSTLLRLMAGLLRPQGGCVLLDGQPLRSPRETARTLAFLPQSRPLPAITVRSLAMHGRFSHLGPTRRPSSRDRDAVQHALERVGMAPLADRDLRTLSGGQRQKAYLAMLIAQEAHHLLLDEPMTHLDIACQLELQQILQSLRDEGRCITVVLHDLSMAASFCDCALLMKDGRFLYHGPMQPCIASAFLEDAFGVRAVVREGVFFETIG